MTGLEYMIAIRDGEHPPAPIQELIGFRLVEVDEGPSFNLVRAITPDTGEIVATGRVLHRGGRVATAEGAVRRTSDDKLVAHGTSTCLIIATD